MLEGREEGQVGHQRHGTNVINLVEAKVKVLHATEAGQVGTERFDTTGTEFVGAEVKLPEGRNVR